MPAPDLNARFEAAHALFRQHRRAEALAALDDLLRTEPGHLPSRISRGSILIALGRQDDAETTWREALQDHPLHEALVWNLGALLMEGDRPDEAMAIAEAVLSQHPTQARALLLRGDVLVRRGRFEEAVATYRRIPRVGDILIDVLTKEARALEALQRHDEALALLDQAVALRPDDRFATFRRAIVRLRRRDFGGWADYEARWRLPNFIRRFGGPVTEKIASQLTLGPSREELVDQSVLLLGEQGIGDQVMFASLIPDLARIAASVTCVCEPRLVSLFAASLPRVTFASPRDARISAGAIDKVIAMGSLGAALRPTAHAFPGTPYLAPRTAVRAEWADRLGPRTRPLRIGLAWRGGSVATRGNLRSLSLDLLAPLLEMPDCEFVNLQHGDVAAELAATPASIRTFPATDLSDFESLAGLAAELDLVISVQTALVHLCGAIGQTCLTFVPSQPEWRYGTTASTMPWYQSVRLYRQETPGDWDPVIVRVASAVRERLAAASGHPHGD